MVNPISNGRPVLSGLWCLILLAGCNGGMNDEFKLFPVQGMVAFKDGRPLPATFSLTLHSLDQKNVQSVASVGTDGTFSQVTFLGFGGDGRPGAVAGKHRVSIRLNVPMGEAAAMLSNDERKQWAAHQALFAPYSETDSRLEVDVERHPTELLIELDAPPEKRVNRTAKCCECVEMILLWTWWCAMIGFENSRI